MKKSIFLTVIAILFAGWVSIYAQTDDTAETPKKPDDCGENANFPVAGVPHAYQVEISGNGYTGAGVYDWYVTQNADDLLGGAVLGDGSDFNVTAPTGDLSAYHSTGNDTKNKLELEWKPTAITNAKPYFLVLKYKETNTTGGDCEINNVKVMKIEPLNRFQLEMVAYDKANSSDFTGGNGVDCAADVASAKYDAASKTIKYTYGQQKLYYKVTAKGFKGDWLPKFQLPELLGKQTYASAKIYKDMTGTSEGPALKTLDTSKEGADAKQVLTGEATLNISDATNGTDYLLEVIINNNTYEAKDLQELTEKTKAVAVDGTYGGTSNDALKDLDESCVEEGDFNDYGKYTVKNRPTVKATSGGFIQRVE